MTKYQPLQNHLISLKTDAWVAQFSEIEDILGFSLPRSAYLYPAWWANQEYSPQCQSWLSVGWVTSELDLVKKIVTFCKGDVRPIKTVKTERRTKVSHVQDSLHEWDEQQSITCSLKMEWKPVGKVVLTEDNRLVLPNVDTVPALYRFRIREDGKESLYVGETVNVQKRFGNYKTGSKGQKTSHRIHEALVTALQGGAEVSVSMITEEAEIDKGNGFVPLDLSSKVARCYLENAAILHGSATDIDNLNKASV